MTIRLGTRGSALALWQANWVAQLLRAAEPGVGVEIITISTEGDRKAEAPLGEMAGRGIFVREIEAALLAGTIDAAVHSAKDLPSSWTTPGLVLASIPERNDPRDALAGLAFHERFAGRRLRADRARPGLRRSRAAAGGDRRGA